MYRKCAYNAMLILLVFCNIQDSSRCAILFNVFHASLPVEPFAIFRPLMEPKCIQFANKDEGLKRREHYCKVLSEEAVKRNFPQLQQVLS